MTDITRSSLLWVSLYSALLVVLFWWGSTISEPVATVLGSDLETDMWRIFKVFQYDYDPSSLLVKIIGSTLTFVVSLQVARLAIKGVLYMERSYMPSLVFVLVSSAYYSTAQSLSPLFSVMLMTLSWTCLLRAYLVKHIITKQVLTAAFNIGLAVIIYPPMLYLAPLLLLYLAMFRVPDVREWLTAVVGVVLPSALLFLYIWVFDFQRLDHCWEMFFNSLTLNDGSTNAILQGGFQVIDYAFAGVCLVLYLLSILRFIRTRKNYKRRSALGLQFFIYSSFWIIAVMLFSPVRSMYLLPLLALPLSVIIPSYFASHKATFWSNSLYLIFLLSAIAIHLVDWLVISG